MPLQLFEIKQVVLEPAPGWSHFIEANHYYQNPLPQ